MSTSGQGGSNDVNKKRFWRSSAATCCCGSEGCPSADAVTRADRGGQSSKNDRIDASKICGLLAVRLPARKCHMVSTEVRERRRTLRYRKLLVRQNVQLRNKVSQMLMESGTR